MVGTHHTVVNILQLKNAMAADMSAVEKEELNGNAAFAETQTFQVRSRCRSTVDQHLQHADVNMGKAHQRDRAVESAATHETNKLNNNDSL